MDEATVRSLCDNSDTLKPAVVLSDDDPYFLLDLDACRDPQTGAPSPGVAEIFAMFPGCAAEVSINGTGYHIMGQVNPAALGERRNKFNFAGIDCEFYHTGRFVALGQGLEGNIDLDWTNSLAGLVPTREAVTQIELVDQADPSYTGPDDDDELIAMMISSRGSAAAMFGDKASVKELWEADVAKLSHVFPSSTNDDFDRSSADASLMSHLAFWTGKNSERMDRLFQRSALMRDKYRKRADYRVATISSAVSGCRNVYSKPAPAVAQPQDVFNAAPMGSATGIMAVDEQTKYFAGCAYITAEHKILLPNGETVKPPQFKALFGGYQFIISPEGKLSTNSFEAFTENRVARFPKAWRTRFLPQRPFGEFDAEQNINCYLSPVIDTTPGDVSLALDLLTKLLPVERDRAIFLAWCASLVQNPGKKFLWSPVLQGAQGNGKSIWGDILSYCMGDRYTWTPKPDKLEGQFNAFIHNRTFINVEEMNIFEKHALMDTLKDYITGRKQEVEQKGVDSFMDRDYCANWFFCTNHKDAVIKAIDDRRFAIFYSAQQSRADMVRDGMLTGDYFPRFWHWLRDGGGYAAMRHFLMNYNVPPELDPAGACFLAPETSSTHEAVLTSYGVAEQYILDAVEGEEQGFRGGWISSYKAGQLLIDVGLKRSPRKLGTILEGLGYENRGRLTTAVMQEDMKKPTIWSKPGVNTDYQRTQGYI